MSDWMAVGQVSEIPQRGARVVKTASGDIGIFRTADDEIFALRDRCPHKGGPLSQGIVHGRRVTCPLHSWNIELDSGAVVAPDQGCAATFPVEVRDGVVYLQLPA